MWCSLGMLFAFVAPARAADPALTAVAPLPTPTGSGWRPIDTATTVALGVGATLATAGTVGLVLDEPLLYMFGNATNEADGFVRLSSGVMGLGGLIVLGSAEVYVLTEAHREGAHAKPLEGARTVQVAPVVSPRFVGVRGAF